LPDKFATTFDARTAVRVLCAADEKFRPLIARVGPCRIELGHMQSPFQALAESIVYQQLTGKAAATIHGRLVDLFPRKRITPERLLDTHTRRLRGAGLSRAKVKALKDLAAKTLDGVVPPLARLHAMADAEIVERLVTVRGIGPWTVEMLLIFRLGRADVWPVTDYGVRKGFAVTFGWLTTEHGRQPWVIYGLLRTRDAVSPIAAPGVTGSLLAFVIVYFSVFAAGTWYILRLMSRAPAEGETPPGEREGGAMVSGTVRISRRM
jgi:DNA-3-methyladenine glycosylase II